MNKLSFLPKSNSGQWSVFLILVMPILFYLGMYLSDIYTNTPAGDTILQDLLNRPWVSISMLSGFAFGITAFIVGLIGILKKKDNSILVYFSTLMGFLTLVWVCIEIIFPH